MRVAVCLLFVLTASCRCGSQVTQTSGDLVVEPLALDFGTHFVGTHSTLAVTVRNESRSSRHVAVQVDPPFSVEQNELTIGGGESVNVVVHFDPTTVGAESGTLHLTPDGATVMVTATAAPIPDCPSAAACHERHFSLELGACTDSALADGTSCTDACLTGGRCVSGECRGAVPERCDDHDLCTIDACASSDGTCVHAATACPIVDPCTAAYCDPATGCASMPVTDGTPCGEATCRQARICLDGTCQTRPKPGADDECTAVDLVASSDSTCMLTRAGSVRCWGEGYANGYQNLSSGLTSLGFSGPVSTVTKGATTCATLAGGRLECFGGLGVARVDAGAGNSVLLAKNNDLGLCALLSTGALWCSFGFTPRRPLDLFDAGIRSFAADPYAVCALREDGGVACTTSLTPLDPAEIPLDAPALAVRAGHRLSCATHADGVSCWNAQLRPRRLPAGLSEVALPYDSPYPTFLGLRADGGVASCEVMVDGGIACGPAFDGGFAGVQRAAMGVGHECFLTSTGDVACRGDNRVAQLGDLSRAPPGARRVAVNDAVLLAQSSKSVAIVQRDGGVLRWGDGSATARPLTLSGEQVVEFLQTEVLTCVLRRDGGVGCQTGSSTFSPRLPAVLRFGSPEADRVLVAVDGGTCSFTADGSTSCWSIESPMQVATSLSVDVTRCSLWADGGVTCDGSNRSGRLGTGDAVEVYHSVDIASGPVKKVAMSQLQGCVLERAGTVRCWGADPTTFAISAPTPVSGLLPLGRDLVCGTAHCCVLVGDNAVSCWGSNTWNQLGREGVSRLRVPVPMPDRVEQLTAAGDTTCARLRSGEVWCWGDNQHAQLGSTPLLRSDEPVWVTR